MNGSSYVVPYKVLSRQIDLPDSIDDDQDQTVEISLDQLQSLIRQFLKSIPVDETWYVATYQDVEQAIRSGIVNSAKEHFVLNGYFEGRLPGKVVVDEDFYLSQYPDVAEGIEDGEIQSAQEHFETHGMVEGRLPFKL